MRIRIGTKLMAGFALVIVLMVALALYSTTISQKSLQQSVGESSMFLAEEMLRRINHSIYLKIEDLQSFSECSLVQETLSESNREFERLDDIEEYVTQEDRKWVSAPKDQITPFMQDLISNELSDNLRREILLFYEKKYGYRVFEEIFITNRFGANVAQTTKTSDYRQDDEEWWQVTRERGLYVSDVEYDESSGAHGITIGVRIDDETGSFLGALKAILSIKEVIREAEITTKKYETTSIVLTTKDGLLLYRTSAFKFLEDLSNSDLFQMIQDEKGFFTARDGGIEKLFSYAHSRGYREFGGLEWILLVGHNVDEILQPAFRLRNTMLAAALVLIVTGIIIAFSISYSITQPLAKLSRGAEIVGKGDLEHRVEIRTKDEVGELATAFNQMTERRKRAEEELLKVNRALRLLSRSNQAVIRARGESDLLHEICQIAVEVGGYRLAWVGFAEQDERKSVRPVAQVGYEEEYLDTVNITWADTERGRGPTGTAIRSGAPGVARHILTDPNFKPWRAEALKRGYASSIALPLIANGLTIGALNIYAAEPDAFDAEEVKLLTELADDLTYGIMALRTRTERKRAEEELRKHREHLEELVKERTSELEEKTAELERANIHLQEADRLKSVFLASMSHELRTPLNSIIGFTGIILMGMVGEISEEQRKQLTMVKNSANHLLSLINDLLDIAKIESGRAELSLEEFRLDDVAREVVETFSPAVSEKGLELLTEMPAGITPFSDRRRMKQVLMNLVGNAIKFTDQGRVKIAARVLREKNLEISITDTGMGIKKEDMNKLFQPFQQIDMSLTKARKGTGLGLHLTKKLAALLGGAIAAKSEYGKGSEFTFTIPLDYEEEQR